jgi:hypothetical protein
MSFSGYTSSFTNTTSANDIISDVILSSGTGTSGNYGHIILGGLLIQFGTGRDATSSSGTTINLPVTYDSGTYNTSTGWYAPYIIFGLPWDRSVPIYIGSRNNSSFSIYVSTSTSTNINWITIGPVPAAYTNSTSSFSGYKSNLSNSTSINDIISDVILSAGSGGNPTGQYGYIKLGGLLFQFGTGYNSGNGTVNLPVAFASNSNWDSCIFFVTPYSGNQSPYMNGRSRTTITIAGLANSGIWYNWIAIGPSE